jgi:prepilin-type N-terminal cleavage/methylation domain-containing protein
MCCAANKPRAFTLLEVMLAVMVMALVTISIYRFVESSLQAVKLSSEDTIQKQAVQSLVAVLDEEFRNLPPQEANVLRGAAHQFGGKASDQVTWLSQAGNGMFTEDAPGQWKLTLLLRPANNTNTLGLLRQVPDNSNTDDNWLPLLTNVDAIEIRYYDVRLNAWLDEWNDSGSLPTLVRVRIWRTNDTIPYTTIIQLPPSKLPT